MGEQQITFIIPTRNRVASLPRCLASVDSQWRTAEQVIVVDDASSDGTDLLVSSQFPDALLVRMPRHAGVGKALAAGAREATGEIWVNLDDDGYLAADDATQRIATYFAQTRDLGALCFRVETPDGTVRHREIPLRSKRLPDADAEIGYFLGGAVAFRASALEAAGGYPADVPFFSWEHDVAFRLFRAGFRMLFTPSIRFVHLAVPSVHNTAEREAGYADVEMRLAARYLPAPYAQVHAGLWAAKCLAQATANGRPGTTARAVGRCLADWRSLRAHDGDRLTPAETRRLSALSGRTWY